MGVKEDVLAALRGTQPSHVPWTIYQILLPRSDTERLARNRGLGLVKGVPLFHTRHPHMEIEERWRWEGGRRVLRRTHHTPIGSVSERVTTDFAVHNEGYQSEWILEHPIKSIVDYDVLRFIVADAVYEPDYAGFLRAQEKLGDDGIVTAVMGYCPLQQLSVMWAGLDRLAYDLQDYPEVVEGLLEVMAERQTETYQLAAESPATIISSNDNISASRMSPRWFERYILPFYNKQAALLHGKGKLFMSHMDGPLSALKHLVARCDLDIIEAFTPPPVGDLAFEEARAVWPDKAIWSNFPETLFLEGPQVVFEETLRMLREHYSRGRFILGIMEDMPEQAWRSGLTAMTQAVATYQEERSPM